MNTTDNATLQDLILRQLDGIADPCSVAHGRPTGLAEMGLVDRVEISASGEVNIGLRLTSPFCEMVGFFTTEARSAIGCLPGVSAVNVTTDSGFEWSVDHMSPELRAERNARLAAYRAARGGPRPVELELTRRVS